MKNELARASVDRSRGGDTSPSHAGLKIFANDLFNLGAFSCGSRMSPVSHLHSAKSKHYDLPARKQKAAATSTIWIRKAIASGWAVSELLFKKFYRQIKNRNGNVIWYGERGAHIERRNDQQGFAAVALLIFVGLVAISLLSGVAYSYRLVQKEDRAFSTCLAQVWRAQTEQKKILERLLALNKDVAHLRAARIRARIKLAAALSSGVPPAIAAAKAHLAVIETQMVALDIKQKTLLAAADLIARELNMSLAMNLRKSSGGVEKVELEKMALAVAAFPPRELAPFYQPKPLFKEHQSAGAKWKLQNIKGACHASIERRQGQWFVTLSKGKFS